ncbi:MAG: SMP-30/gluconolactonase/LRE family protein [Polyangiales bacterium]
MKRLSTVWLVLALAACGDDDGGDADNPGKPDATVTQDGGRDASIDARVPGDDAGPRLDATVDADTPVTQPDASTDAGSDASTDAGTPATSLRQTICGDKTDWPDPLPAQNQRNARLVKDSFGFLEGPVWIAELNQLLFSDMNFGGDNANGPPAQIRRLAPPSTFDVLKPMSGSNGIALFAPTTLLAATHDTRSLSFFDAKTGDRKNIDIKYNGKKFNSPNDVTVRDDGWVYFSDPDWQRGPRPEETKMAVYRVKLTASTTSAEALLIDDTQTKPNGVALSPDQKTLYVGSSDNDIFKWTVNADGSVSNKTPFVKPGGGSDGMGVDCAGNLYVTSGNSVRVYAPDATMRGQIAVADGPSNVAFGGAGNKTLFITAQDAVYSIELNVPGFPY